MTTQMEGQIMQCKHRIFKIKLFDTYFMKDLRKWKIPKGFIFVLETETSSLPFHLSVHKLWSINLGFHTTVDGRINIYEFVSNKKNCLTLCTHVLWSTLNVHQYGVLIHFDKPWKDPNMISLSFSLSIYVVYNHFHIH